MICLRKKKKQRNRKEKNSSIQKAYSKGIGSGRINGRIRYKFIDGPLKALEIDGPRKPQLRPCTLFSVFPVEKYFFQRFDLPSSPVFVVFLILPKFPHSNAILHLLKSLATTRLQYLLPSPPPLPFLLPPISILLFFSSGNACFFVIF